MPSFMLFASGHMILSEFLISLSAMTACVASVYKGNTALAVMVCVMFFFNLNSVISRTQRCVKEYTPIGLAENWADHKAMSEKLEELIIGMLNTLRSELKSTVSN